MRLKLHENFGTSVQAQFHAAGHDAATVVSEGLSGAADHRVIEVCAEECRALVTLDLDFANPLVFPPTDIQESSPSCACHRGQRPRI